jgi:hypothetical protein
MLVTGDLRLAMARLEVEPRGADHVEDVAQETLALGPWIVRVVRVPHGHRFEHPVKVATMALLLSGLGTLVVDDWRATLVSGQLASLAKGQRMALVADGDEPVIAALWHLEGSLGAEPGASGAPDQGSAENAVGPAG